MKSICSILSVAVFCNLAVAGAAENYSLWPRRPAELQQARGLLAEKKGAEAAHLLAPFLKDEGIAGREARQLVASVNTPRYLTRQHPGAFVYTVQSGDTVQKIAKSQQCPSDLIMLLNGLVEPGGLRIGQKLVIVKMSCRAEIHLAQRELSIWDGDTLVADYPIVPEPQAKLPAESSVTISSREGHIQGTAIPSYSSQFSCADRSLTLSDGLQLKAATEPAKGRIGMDQRDLNEISYLLPVGAEVRILP